MWLFSDLHALEVELWIHCFCTRRRTPFKSSDCYQANLCLAWRFSVMTCFLATTFQKYSFVCPRQIINVETWHTVWNLDWMWVLEISCASVSGYNTVTIEPRASIGRFLSWFSFSHLACALNTKQYCIINLWNRSSQATLMGFYIILYSVGWSCIVFGAQIQIWDIF